MREIDILYTNVELIIDKLNSFVIQDLRKLCEPERDSLTEAYDLLVHALSCINDASFYRKHEEDEEEEVQVFPVGEPLGPKNPDPVWVKDDEKYDGYREVYPEDYTYTSEQKGEEVPEGTPIDNSNHVYFIGNENKFTWDVIDALKKCTEDSNTINYDDFSITYAGEDTIVIKKKGWDEN